MEAVHRIQGEGRQGMEMQGTIMGAQGTWVVVVVVAEVGDLDSVEDVEGVVVVVDRLGDEVAAEVSAINGMLSFVVCLIVFVCLFSFILFA